VGHSCHNALRAVGRGWTLGYAAPAPPAGAATDFFRQLSRYSSAFALAVDMALLTLGGNLKRREMISARFGDVLSELYLLSAALKRWNEEGRQEADLPLVQWCMAQGFATIEMRFDEIFANFPVRPVAWLLRFLLLPFGTRTLGPSDALSQACAAILLEPSAARDRLTVDIYHGADDGGVGRLDRAFALISAVKPLRDRLRQAHAHDIAVARQRGLINDAEADQLKAVQLAIAAVVAVDDFPAEEISPRRAARAQGDVSSPTATPIQSNAAE
jgi:acyl-CoA dehydrogenase